MKALQWPLVVVGVLGVLLFLAIAIVPVWLNTIVHTDAFRHEVESRAAQSVGGTVQIDSIDFSLWSGVRLHGLVTRIESSRVNGQGALVARVEQVSCNYSLFDLLHRRLELTGVTLVKPQIILTRQPAADVPTPPPTPAEATADAKRAATPPTPGGRATPFQFIFEKARIEDGSLSVRDASGVSLAELDGIRIAAKTSGSDAGQNLEGTIRIADMTLPPGLHVTDFSTPFTYRAPGAAQANPFEAAAFDGRIAGDYTLAPDGPSLLDINAKGVDVAKLDQALAPSSSTKITGSLDLQSKWRSVETGQIDGEGDAQLTGAQLSGVPLLGQLAGLLRVKELESPQLRTAQTHFQAGRDQTRFTGLQVDAGVFQMTGDGTIANGGALDANLVLILTRDTMGRIPKEVAMFFVQQQDGSASIAFHLAGTLDHPQTDLATRILLNAVPMKNMLNKALNKFFH